MTATAATTTTAAATTTNQAAGSGGVEDYVDYDNIHHLGQGPHGLPTGVIAILKAWLLSPEHMKHLYPTQEEQTLSLQETGIEKKQLQSWFSNARCRIWKPLMLQKEKEEEEQRKRAIPNQEDNKSTAATTTTATVLTASATTTAIDNRNMKRNDVLCGWGTDVYNHTGNQRFRKIAREYLQEYMASTTIKERRDVVSQILACINDSHDSGGRFLKSNGTFITVNSTWLILSHSLIVAKISQFLRKLIPWTTSATVAATATSIAATTTGMMSVVAATKTTATTTTVALPASATVTATTTTNEVNELWDVICVIPQDEKKVECRGCTDQAVATWSSNQDPEDKRDLCEKCQLEEFGGWPDGVDLIKHCTTSNNDGRVTNDDDSN